MSKSRKFKVENVFETETAQLRGLASVIIQSVSKYSPADRAHLRPGDRLTHIAGISVTEKGQILS